MLFHPDLGEMRVWIQMTGGLDDSLQETERLMSEGKIQETRPQEQRETTAKVPSQGYLVISEKLALKGNLLHKLFCLQTVSKRFLG